MHTHTDEFQQKKSDFDEEKINEIESEWCQSIELNRKKELIKIFRADGADKIAEKIIKWSIAHNEGECALARLEMQDRNKYIEIMNLLENRWLKHL